MTPFVAGLLIFGGVLVLAFLDWVFFRNPARRDARRRADLGDKWWHDPYGDL